jgi:hypothetical protein
MCLAVHCLSKAKRLAREEDQFEGDVCDVLACWT